MRNLDFNPVKNYPVLDITEMTLEQQYYYLFRLGKTCPWNVILKCGEFKMILHPPLFDNLFGKMDFERAKPALENIRNSRYWRDITLDQYPDATAMELYVNTDRFIEAECLVSTIDEDDDLPF